VAYPRLIDLINAGSIPIGTRLFHRGRRESERSVEGVIQAGGIEVRGQVFKTPSGAARAVSGTGAENGWRWWRVAPNGEMLSKLRGNG
jgi:Restriction Enzyme Adenine Methylase Associated